MISALYSIDDVAELAAGTELSYYKTVSVYTIGYPGTGHTVSGAMQSGSDRGHWQGRL